MTQIGWQFTRGDYFVFVAIADVKFAREVALRHLKADPAEEPKPIPEAVLSFLEMKEGDIVSAPRRH